MLGMCKISISKFAVKLLTKYFLNYLSVALTYLRMIRCIRNQLKMLKVEIL